MDDHAKVKDIGQETETTNGSESLLCTEGGQAHHWRIDSPRPGRDTTQGTCRYCFATKEFPWRSTHETSWQEAAQRGRETLPSQEEAQQGEDPLPSQEEAVKIYRDIKGEERRVWETDHRDEIAGIFEKEGNAGVARRLGVPSGTVTALKKRLGLNVAHQRGGRPHKKPPPPPDPKTLIPRSFTFKIEPFTPPSVADTMECLHLAQARIAEAVAERVEGGETITIALASVLVEIMRFPGNGQAGVRKAGEGDETNN